MEITSPFRLLLLIALGILAGGPPLSAQNAGNPPAVPLAAEIQNLEKNLGRSASGGDRSEALVRLARLRQLSGDIEGAAQNWLEAAALSGANGDRALAAGAFCLAAIGEWEQAARALGPLLAAGREGPALLQARCLDACLRAWNSGDAAALRALADNPEYGGLKSVIYYTLWKTLAANPGVSGAGTAGVWKARLLAEFPQSPEGRIAAAEDAPSASAAISARPSPMWLLLPGRDGFSVAPAGGPSSAALPGTAKTLQTGLFSSEANARIHIEKLTGAGFVPALVRRTVNGAEYWAVTVPAGQNMNQTIAELKNAGFESFPVF